MSFKFEFTQDKLANILSKNKEVAEWYSLMNTMLPKYDINTESRVAGFLAQCGHRLVAHFIFCFHVFLP